MQEPRRLTGESASILGFSLKRQRHLVSRVITLDRKHFRVRPAIHPIKQQKISASCSKEPVAWQSFNMIRAKVLPAQRIAPPRRVRFRSFVARPLVDDDSRGAAQPLAKHGRELLRQNAAGATRFTPVVRAARMDPIPCLCVGKRAYCPCIAFLSTAAPRRGISSDPEQQLSPKLFSCRALSAGCRLLILRGAAVSPRLCCTGAETHHDYGSLGFVQ